MHNPSRLSFRSAGCLSILLAFGLSGCKSPSTTVSPSAATGPGAQAKLNAEFKKPDMDAQKWLSRFEREGREIYDRRQQIVAAVHLQPGDAIADVGAGTGLFTLLFAQAVGEQGTVYAVDISEKFLQLIDQRASEAGRKNIHTLRGTDKSTQLPRDSVNRVFICDTYHHFEHPQSTLASIHQALKKKGELMVIDFKKVPGKSREWIMNHVRATQEETTREIEAAGFRKVEELDLLKENYVLRFRKADK